MLPTSLTAQVDYQKVLEIEKQIDAKDFSKLDYIIDLYSLYPQFPSPNKGLALRCFKILVKGYQHPEKFIAQITLQKAVDCFQKTFSFGPNDLDYNIELISKEGTPVAFSELLLTIKYGKSFSRIREKKFSKQTLEAFRDYTSEKKISTSRMGVLVELVAIAKILQDELFEIFIWNRISDLLLFVQQESDFILARSLLENAEEIHIRLLLEQYVYIKIFGKDEWEFKNSKLAEWLEDKLRSDRLLSKPYAILTTGISQAALKSLEPLQGKLDAFTHVAFAEVNIRLGNIVKAGLHLQSFLNQRPDNVIALVTQANIWFMSKDNEKLFLERATGSLMRASIHSPHNVFIHFALAQIFYKQDKREEAQQKCQHVLTIQPLHERARALLGIILDDDCWNKPQSIEEVYNELGFLFYIQKNFSQARQCLSRSQSILSSNNLYLLARSCFELGDNTQAKNLLESIVAKEIDNTQATKLLIRTLNKIGNFKEAEAAYDKLVELDEEAHELYAESLLGQQRSFDAVTSLKMALGIYPDSESLRALLVTCYRIQDKHELAARTLGKTQSINKTATPELLIEAANQLLEQIKKELKKDPKDPYSESYSIDYDALHKAEEFFIEALVREPNNSQAQEGLQKTLFKQSNALGQYFAAGDHTSLIARIGILALERGGMRLTSFIATAEAYPKKNAFLLAVLGIAYLERKRVEMAEQCRKEATQTEPNHPYVLILEGKILGPKTPDEGIKRFTQAISKDPDNTLAIASKAELCFSQDDTSKKLASLDLKKALEIHKNDGFLLTALGIIQWKWHNLDEAEKLLKKAQIFRPRNVAILSALGSIFYIKGELDAAKEEFYQACSEEPTTPYLCASLGNIYLQKHLKKNSKDYTKKIQTHFASSLRYSSRLKNMLIESICLFLEQDAPEEARIFLQKFKKNMPSHVQIMAMEGAITISSDLRLAEISLKEALKFEPRSPLVNTLLGYLYKKQQRIDFAQQHFKKAKEQDPHNLFILQSLAQISLELGDYTEAKNSSLAILQVESMNPLAHQNLGIASFFLNELVEAIKHLQPAAILMPDKAHVAKFLGWAYLQSGNSQEAKTELDRAKTLAPTDHSIDLLLIEIERKNGQPIDHAIWQTTALSQMKILQPDNSTLLELLLAFNPWRTSQQSQIAPKQRELVSKRKVSVSGWQQSSAPQTHSRGSSNDSLHFRISSRGSSEGDSVKTELFPQITSSPARSRTTSAAVVAAATAAELSAENKEKPKETVDTEQVKKKRGFKALFSKSKKEKKKD